MSKQPNQQQQPNLMNLSLPSTSLNPNQQNSQGSPQPQNRSLPAHLQNLSPQQMQMLMLQNQMMQQQQLSGAFNAQTHLAQMQHRYLQTLQMQHAQNQAAQNQQSNQQSLGTNPAQNTQNQTSPNMVPISGASAPMAGFQSWASSLLTQKLSYLQNQLKRPDLSSKDRETIEKEMKTMTGIQNYAAATSKLPTTSSSSLSSTQSAAQATSKPNVPATSSGIRPSQPPGTPRNPSMSPPAPNSVSSAMSSLPGVLKKPQLPGPNATPRSTSIAKPTARIPSLTQPHQDQLTSSGTGIGGSMPSTEQGNKVLGKRKLMDLVHQIDPNEKIDDEVSELLLELADDFIESVTTFACQLAKHRKSDTLEVKDLQLHLERNYNIRIPGFFTTTPESIDLSISKRKMNSVVGNHQQRVAMVKKAVFDEGRKDK
ncbi:transcription initiation factor TFIID subunit A-domain-containing protein [Paraphysoderma sedebokerense]|nr:transcription initiation factor TFIID subunit A-domain-containing protein [Paraphysoderma sedebokerense]